MTSSTQPALGAIRLAWWREALERLDTSPAPPEPRLQSAAAELLPRGVRGADLARLEDGWATLLDEEPDPQRVAARGESLFAAGAKLLGATDGLLGDAGRLHAGEAAVRAGLLLRFEPGGELARLQGHRFARTLRPLTGLARLAARDARLRPRQEVEATPGRALALLSHRLSGRVA